MFKGIVVEKDEAGYRATLRDIDEAQLPEGNVTVRVSHSTLNYKDAPVSYTHLTLPTTPYV